MNTLVWERTNEREREGYNRLSFIAWGDANISQESNSIAASALDEKIRQELEQVHQNAKYTMHKSK